MNKEELLTKINEWHETEDHKKIVDAIEALPCREQDYELTGLLARAYNNLAVFDGTTPEEERPRLLEKAVALLESVSDEGKEDKLWNFRMGYALFYLHREKDAMVFFLRAAELDPDDKDTKDFIAMCNEADASDAVTYSDDEMDAVEGYIGKFFGEFEQVYHEIYSPDIHVDICLIPPSEEFNHYTLVTLGMGAYRMNVPKELADYRLERAELVVFLPPDWKLDEAALKDEQWYWPIRLLKATARLPVQCDSWLAWGHSVQTDDDETYAENTELCGCILIDPKTRDDERAVGELPNGEQVHFYQLIPLYRDEIAYKIEHGADALLEKLSSAVSYVIDPYRLSSLNIDWRTKTWTEPQ